MAYLQIYRELLSLAAFFNKKQRDKNRYSCFCRKKCKGLGGLKAFATKLPYSNNNISDPETTIEELQQTLYNYL